MCQVVSAQHDYDEEVAISRPTDNSRSVEQLVQRSSMIPVTRHETSIDGGGEQAHRYLKQRGSPPVESRGSKHPPQTRRPQPLRPPPRRAGPRAVAAPSLAFSSRKVTQFSNFNLGTCVTPEELSSRGALGSTRRSTQELFDLGTDPKS
eukprot:COSAG02_NODE_1483_length_12385_cov_116.196565_1_plen_148_part_10